MSEQITNILLSEEPEKQTKTTKSEKSENQENPVKPKEVKTQKEPEESEKSNTSKQASEILKQNKDTKTDEEKNDEKRDQLERKFRNQYVSYRENVQNYFDQNYRVIVSQNENGETVYTPVTEHDRDGIKLRQTIDKEHKELIDISNQLVEIDAEYFTRTKEKYEKEYQDQHKDQNEAQQETQQETQTEKNAKENSVASWMKKQGNNIGDKYEAKADKYSKKYEKAKNKESDEYTNQQIEAAYARQAYMGKKAQKWNTKAANMKDAKGLSKIKLFAINKHAHHINKKYQRAAKKYDKMTRKNEKIEEREAKFKSKMETAKARKEAAKKWSQKGAEAMETVSSGAHKMSEKAKAAYYNTRINVAKEYGAGLLIGDEKNYDYGHNYEQDVDHYIQTVAQSFGENTQTEAEQTQYKTELEEKWDEKRNSLAEEQDLSSISAICTTMGSGSVNLMCPRWKLKAEGERLGKAPIEDWALTDKRREEITKAGEQLAKQCTNEADYIWALESIKQFNDGVQESLKTADDLTRDTVNSNLAEINYLMAGPVMEKTSKGLNSVFFSDATKKILGEYKLDGFQMEDGHAIEAGTSLTGFEHDSNVEIYNRIFEEEDKQKQEKEIDQSSSDRSSRVAQAEDTLNTEAIVASKEEKALKSKDSSKEDAGA